MYDFSLFFTPCLAMVLLFPLFIISAVGFLFNQVAILAQISSIHI